MSDFYDLRNIDLQKEFSPEHQYDYFRKYSIDQRTLFGERYLSSYARWRDSLISERENYYRSVEEKSGCVGSGAASMGEKVVGGDIDHVSNKAISIIHAADSDKHLKNMVILNIKMRCVETSLMYLPLTDNNANLSLQELERIYRNANRDETNVMGSLFHSLLEMRYIHGKEIRQISRDTGINDQKVRRLIKSGFKYIFVPESIFYSLID